MKSILYHIWTVIRRLIILAIEVPIVFVFSYIYATIMLLFIDFEKTMIMDLKFLTFEEIKSKFQNRPPSPPNEPKIL
jgi:hypothetical protein